MEQTMNFLNWSRDDQILNFINYTLDQIKILLVLSRDEYYNFLNLLNDI